MNNTPIQVIPDDPNSSDCKGTGPINYGSIADVILRVEQLDNIFGVDNWSVWMTIKLPISVVFEPGV